MGPDELATLARTLRKEVLSLHFRSRAGHIGCSLSCLELMIAALVLRRTAQETFILSKGHAALAYYCCLRHLGLITEEQFATVYQDGTTLPAHPAPGCYPDIPFALGSLGHGLPIAAGIALADKMTEVAQWTYVLMSDGETNAGTTWEAAHFANRHQLDRLVVLLDRNGLQGFGRTSEVLGDTAHPRYWESFGFQVEVAPGHDVRALLSALDRLRDSRDGRPKVLIGDTTKGNGVTFMADRLEWHYLPMSAAQYESALQEP